MPLRAHEAYELNHLLMGCVNTINNMGIFINQAKDPELKSLLQQQLNAHIQDYNIKVEWAKNGSSSQQLNVPPTPSKTAGTPKQPSAVTPNPNGTAHDDRGIATAYLLGLKANGKEYASASFEADDIQLREFLMDAFTMCNRHAFELAGWMRKNGYYPGEQASNTYLAALSQTYDAVPVSAGLH
jgi:spore coat protein CotF